MMKGIAGYNGKIPVGVKTLTSRDPWVIGKFKEEAELMKKFVHPNIVSLLGNTLLNATNFVIKDALDHYIYNT